MNLERSTLKLPSGEVIATYPLDACVTIVQVHAGCRMQTVIRTDALILVTSILVMPRENRPVLETDDIGILKVERNARTVFKAPVASLMNRYRARVQAGPGSFPPILISPIEFRDRHTFYLDYVIGNRPHAWIDVEIQMAHSGHTPRFVDFKSEGA